MNKNIQTVLHYHATTKHSQQCYAKSLGYMDWAMQPNPFREYADTQKIKLPLATSNTTLPYSLIDEDVPSAPLLKESLAQFLEFSMGIAAWKESGGNTWAVRCNASSGNLHPTESYLILPPCLADTEEKSAVVHYAPKEHNLEILARFETSFWQDVPDGSFIVGLSSISWREAWKYGERAFRYVNLDAGHAWQSIVVSAKMLGWKTTRLDSTSNADIHKLMGLNQKSRFHEEEHADMLLLISPEILLPSQNLDTLIESIPLFFHGIANQLSPSVYPWEIIESIEKATSVDEKAQAKVLTLPTKRVASKESKEVVLQRRSVHVMDKESSTISTAEFYTLLRSVQNSLDSKENATHLAIFVNRVEGLKQGLYILVRNPKAKEKLQKAMSNNFLWKEQKLSSLYLLHEHDYTLFSKTVSCGQDIASDGAFSLGMLAQYSQELVNFGEHRYKELYWECGAIGQQLYLEATSLGLSGTGIGCFLDDMMHETLGLQDNQFQILYHFTVGRGYVDSRIKTISV